jgi:nucleoside-diphosphate-sugar epimerase
VRVVLTGGAGFVGGAIAAALIRRCDRVVAIVRGRRRAAHVEELGAELVEDDLSSVGRLEEHLSGADAVIHAAGSYRVGIPKSERPAVWDANVGTTTRLLDAAERARTPRVLYVSTVNVFGNTRGRIVDESYRRDLADGFLSWYDETKYRAHEIAEQRIASGAPVLIVLPSQVYGRADHSAIGDQLRRAFDGTLRYRALDDVGFGLVHVEDLAAGILAALDREAVGHSYVLSGPTTTLGAAIDLAAQVGGTRPPRFRVPTRSLRATAALGRLVGQTNLAEVISASDGVTYWASARRANDELGWAARPIEAGLRDTFRSA